MLESPILSAAATPVERASPTLGIHIILQFESRIFDDTEALTYYVEAFDATP
jgi:hypothetical protein